MTCIARHHPKGFALLLLLFLLITAFMILTAPAGGVNLTETLLEQPEIQLNIIATAEDFA